MTDRPDQDGIVWVDNPLSERLAHWRKHAEQAHRAMASPEWRRWDPDGRIIIIPDRPHVGEWETLTRRIEEGTTVSPENLEALARRIDEGFGPVVEKMRYWSEQNGNALAAWCRLAGLIDTPPEPRPRPWKVHQSRFRQRSHR